MFRTSVFKFLQIGTVMLMVLAFTLGAAGAQPAQAAPSTLISDGWMPFSGSLTNSNININGLVHIVTRWNSVSASQMQVNISANLPTAGVSVITDTGNPYSAFGGGTSSVFIPTDPIIPTDPLHVLVPSFWLVTVSGDRLLPPNPILPPNPVLPPDPIRPYGFGLQFHLVFSAAGLLDFSASSVEVVDLTDVGGDG